MFLRNLTSISALVLYANIVAQADTSAPARKAIQAQYNRMAFALDRRDINLYMSMCAADYKQKIPSTVIDHDRLRNQLVQLLSTVKNYHQSTRIETFNLHGREAHVVTIETCRFAMAEPETVWHNYEQSVRNIDVWVYRHKQWLLKSTETQASK